MSEYRRVHLPGGVFFFTVVTRNRIPYFLNEQRITILREAFRRVMVVKPFTIEAIVVLPDHLHCIWRLPDADSDFSGRWREIKKAASAQINVFTNQRGERPVWQRRFWEHTIRDPADWHRYVDYIYFNPVKHGLALRPVDWPWSSFRQAVRRGEYDLSWGEQEPETVAGMDVE